MHRKNVTECLPLRWSATRYQSFVFYCPLTIPKIWSFESLSEEKFSFRSYPWAMIRFTLTMLKNYFVLIVYQIFYQILNEGKWYSWALSTWIGPLDLHFILKRLSIKLCYVSFSIFQISFNHRSFFIILFFSRLTLLFVESFESISCNHVALFQSSPEPLMIAFILAVEVLAILFYRRNGDHFCAKKKKKYDWKR